MEVSSRLGASVIDRGEVDSDDLELDATDNQQRNWLMIVLLINFVLFVVEIATGFLANSMGLVVDSLDMVADALVYGLSLYAVGKAVIQKKQVVKMSGYLQLALAVFGLLEVVRRFLGEGDEPSFTLMIGISLLALVGNVISLLILQRARSEDVNIKASWIFTSNDVVVNISVIVAGVLVYLSSSKLPDLLVGTAVFCLVGSGAFRILKLSR